jgi:hypothetical protein
MHKTSLKWATALTVTLTIVLGARVGAFQDSSKHPSPADADAPTWDRMVRLSDGRTFVTDGSLAIDVALVKPSVLPTEVLGPAAAKLLEGYMAAPLENEYGLGDLKKGPWPQTYAAPSGVVLNATYVDYLRRTLPKAALRFRMKGDLDPVVILMKGTAVGVVMPMRR